MASQLCAVAGRPVPHVLRTLDESVEFHYEIPIVGSSGDADCAACAVWST